MRNERSQCINIKALPWTAILNQKVRINLLRNIGVDDESQNEYQVADYESNDEYTENSITIEAEVVWE